MGKIFCLMGKSSSGKDAIYKMLSEQEEISFSKIIPYTTRPMRQGEQEGVEYHFTSEERLSELTAQGKVIEVRAYDTVYGIWKYFTVDDGQIDLTSHDYLVIGTLEVYLALRGYYGKNVVVPIYIEVDDGLRLQRALDRERMQDTPKYAEMCRRFLADEKDFSEEKLREAEITTRFTNEELHVTVSDILRYIRRMR